MVVVKYIVLFAVVCLTIWLLIDTSVSIAKKIKARRAQKKENQEDSKTD